MGEHGQFVRLRQLMCTTWQEKGIFYKLCGDEMLFPAVHVLHVLGLLNDLALLKLRA